MFSQTKQWGSFYSNELVLWGKLHTDVQRHIMAEFQLEMGLIQHLDEREPSSWYVDGRSHAQLFFSLHSELQSKRLFAMKYIFSPQQFTPHYCKLIFLDVVFTFRVDSSTTKVLKPILKMMPHRESKSSVSRSPCSVFGMQRRLCMHACIICDCCIAEHAHINITLRRGRLKTVGYLSCYAIAL